MQIIELGNKILKVIFSYHDINVDLHFSNTQYLESAGILTFGDMNSRIFESVLKRQDHHSSILNLCFDDDKSIGLDMPRTWYLNKGKHALAIAHYYNYLNFHGVVEQHNLDSFNKKIVETYGHVACIEIYNEVTLLDNLTKSGYQFFGTPRTLTECVRYLEGWDLIQYPRLKGYATFSKYIELWCRLYFPQFNSAEWHLGKEKSLKINRKRPTNVRTGVRFFWEHFLLQKHHRVDAEDVEVDILSPKFCEKRQPDIILISEDLFSKNNNSGVELFANLTTKLKRNSIYLSKHKNEKAMKNAMLAREQYPNSLIVLMENDLSMPCNFSLINPIKHSINIDIVLSTSAVKTIIENYKQYTGQKYKHLICQTNITKTREGVY